ncbi:MAG: dipeptide epimerase [Verrucomicrobiae bacterium]|nr:dipeptide epimerase [Verrucomicrobiae bacterium]
MELKITNIHLPLRHPFTISLGTLTIQHNLLVELTQDGVTGYGECATGRAYSSSPESMRASLEAARQALEAEVIDDPVALWYRLEPVIGHDRFAFCGLDQAAHDLWGKLNGAPVWKLWGQDIANIPFSDYTIGIDDIDIMVAKMKEFDGWPIYKIKLGTDRDLEIVRALREHTDAVFRIDANAAWTAEQTIAFAPELKDLGVEFLEQPLMRDDWAGMKKVKAECALPVIADESCLTESDVERCAGLFDGINIKLSKAGGLTPGRRMIARAREMGLEVMVGCMTESTVGISAIAQLLPQLDYVDMDGAVLITEEGDVATGVRLDHGRAIFPDDVNGNGVQLRA